jgi:hypothetical protein
MLHMILPRLRRKGLKMEFINPWNVEGAFVRPKGMTKNLYVNSNLVQYLLQTDIQKRTEKIQWQIQMQTIYIQKRTEKIQWQIQTLHRDFSPGNPNRENQHILY